MAPFLRRSTLFSAAGLLALAAAAGPAAALGVTPGALSSFKVSGGQQLGEGSQGSAQQCLDACFNVANCNAASFCVNSAGGKLANTCVWFRVDDIYNPPGEASGNWLSGTISSTTTQSQQQAAQAVQPVYVGNNGVRPATVATAAVVSNNNAPVARSPTATATAPPSGRSATVAPAGRQGGGSRRGAPSGGDPIGRRLMMAAAA